MYPFEAFKFYEIHYAVKSVSERSLCYFSGFEITSNSLCSEINVGAIVVYPFKPSKLCEIHYAVNSMSER